MLLNFLLGVRQVRPEWKCPVVFLRPGPFVEVLRDAGFEVAVTVNVRIRNPLSCCQAIVRLVREIRTRRVDGVFSWVAYGHLFGGLAAWVTKTRCVWYQIGFASGAMDRLAALVPARCILAVSRYIGGLQSRLWPRRPVFPVLPGIDLDEYLRAGRQSRLQLRAQLGLPTEGPLTVMVGRLQRWKGMHIAIAAMPEVRRFFPTARLAIVGGVHEMEVGYSDEIDEMIAGLSLKDCVIMVGSQSNVAEWMGAADVVVHASRKEPFGIVALEAMACGRPVITGSDGGVIEAVRDGVEGFHVPFGDSLRLAGALTKVFGDRAATAAMAQRGLERSKQFTRTRYAEEICGTLEEALQLPRSTKSA